MAKRTACSTESVVQAPAEAAADVMVVKDDLALRASPVTLAAASTQRTGTWVPTQISQRSAETCTVVLSGSMGACASSGSWYSASMVLPSAGFEPTLRPAMTGPLLRALGERLRELRGREIGVRARIPDDVERLETALRGPEMLADHRDRVVDLEHVDDARQRPRAPVVDRTQRAAEGRAGLDGGDLHARHLHVDAELRGAHHLGGRIDAAQRLADERERRRDP